MAARWLEDKPGKKVKQVIVSLDIKAIVVKIVSANFVYRLKLQSQNKTTF